MGKNSDIEWTDHTFDPAACGGLPRAEDAQLTP